MNNKPTDGPWTYGVRKDGSIWLSIGFSEAGEHYQGDLVASAADAQLIVSAKDLLRALKTARAQLITLGGNPRKYPKDNGFDTIHAAVLEEIDSAIGLTE